MVAVTLAHEVSGWPFGRFTYKIIRRKKVEQDLDTMLTRLKAVVEGIYTGSDGQQLGGKCT